MYNNLRGEIAKTGLTKNKFAESVGIIPATFSKKLNNKTKWKIDEMITIRDSLMQRLDVVYDLDYLFKL